MKIFVISIRVKDGLLDRDTTHMIVSAASWDKFCDKINLHMWWSDDDVSAEGYKLKPDDDEVKQYRLGQESFIRKAKRGEWLRTKNGGSACIEAHSIDKRFYDQLAQMGLLKEQGRHGAGPML